MLWIRALHVIAVIMWAGPLLLLTQVFVLHTAEASDGREALRRLEERLFNTIVNPAAAIVLVTGLLMFLSAPTEYLRAHWFHVKLLLAIVLFSLHIRIFRRMLALHGEGQRVMAREFQLLHGLSALVVILVVILVIVKPF
jgi:putative membrane protein